MKYQKKPLNPKEQIAKLKTRGLIFNDEALAEQQLMNISYYRLRAYTFPFQNNESGQEHFFLRNDISFEDIIDLYCFDRQLRSLIFSAIEKIEVAMRTRIALTYSVDTGDGFWFLDESLFFQRYKFLKLTQNETGRIGELMKEVKRSNEDFIAHYFGKYGDPLFPPSWMTLEVVSMGTLSKLFAALDKNNISSKKITQDLGLYKVDILKNWLHALSSLRNTCAHHSRVWNRRFTINLQYPYRTTMPFLSRVESSKIRDNKIFGYLSIILYLSQFISPNSLFKNQLIDLLRNRPKLAQLKDMGFPEDWENYTLWK